MEQEKEGREAVKKLDIDRPLNFKYHAAYLAYSQTWDENSSEEARNKLNDVMASLTDEEDSYSNFYSDLSQFRKESNDFSGRSRIRTRSKREWRKSEANAERLSRYRK
jgi:hypothetical protein